jgi:hypothetical protein
MEAAMNRFQVQIIPSEDPWGLRNTTNYGCRRTFDTYEEARDFLKTRMRELEGLTQDEYEGQLVEVDSEGRRVAEY